VLILNHLLIAACLLLLYPLASLAQPANRFDIVIDEIFPDPSPAIGLPNSEFIELRNNSSNPIPLRHWKISDGSSTATINSDFVLEPGAYVIICPNAAAVAYNQFGNAIGVSNFPSLNNDRDLIVLYSPEGKIIHAIEYAVDWYQNDVKRDGGWTLEMIDVYNPCGGSNNWKASNDPNGGTPGKINSVNGSNADDLAPALIRTYTIDSTTIVAVFDESLDSTSAAYASHYKLEKLGTPFTASPVPPLFSEVILQFGSALSINTSYQLTVANIADCAGNLIGIRNTALAAIPVQEKHFDIAINEILFNPPPDGYDYIELYNRSNKTIDLQKLYIANKNAAGNLTNSKQISDKPLLLFPNTYCVISTNIDWLRSHYPLKGHPLYIQLTALPSMPDDKGHIVLINFQGEVIDQLQYDSKWHFALLENEEGVALERISYNDSTQNRNNWTSAAATAGYGTPGYQNSQFRADLQAQGVVTVSPKIFASINNEFATIHCQLEEPGYVINIQIFDDKGRPVRRLTSNTTMGESATFHWDGLDDQRKPLPIGHYIILTEVFNLQGKTKKYKNVVTLAGKL